MNKFSYRRIFQKKIDKNLSLTRMIRPHNNPNPLPNAEPRAEGGPKKRVLVKA